MDYTNYALPCLAAFVIVRWYLRSTKSEEPPKHYDSTRSVMGTKTLVVGQEVYMFCGSE